VSGLHEPVAQAPLVLPSDLDDRLEQNRLSLAERRRLDHRPVTRLIRGRSRLEHHGLLFTAADTPQGAATPYQDTDREVVARPSNLHVSVGKAEPQDRYVAVVVVSHRRARESSSGLEAAVHGNSVLRHEREICRARRSEPTGALLRVLDTLDMHRVDSVLRCSALRDPNDLPELPVTAHRLADRRSGAAAEVVLIVAVREADYERPCRHALMISAFARLKPLSPRRLHESVADAPLMLAKEHAAKLGQRVRAGMVERPEQALSVLDRARDHDGSNASAFSRIPRVGSSRDGRAPERLRPGP